MNIRKSRIVQIIKEEIQRMSEDDDGIAPVPLEKPSQWATPSEDVAAVELEIMRLKKQIVALQRQLKASEEKREQLVSNPPDETELAEIPDWVEEMYKKKMGG